MDSIDFCGFLWVSGEFLQISVEFNGFLENFYGFFLKWILMGLWRISMDSRICMDLMSWSACHCPLFMET